MSNVITPPSWWKDKGPPSMQPPGPPSMELLERVIKIEAALPTLATKEDLAREIGGLRTELHREIGAQTWKVVSFVTGFGALLTAAVFFIARNIH